MRNRVVIIGGGLSGLASGFELMKQNWHVTVLESTSRPGGRVMTVRDRFSDGLYAEAGAEGINAKHAFTLKYAREFGLKLKPISILGAHGQTLSILSAPWSIRLRIRGRVFTPPQLMLNPFRIPYRLKFRERLVFPLGLTDLYTRRLEKKYKDIGNPLHAELLHLDKISFADFLIESRASPDAVALIEEHHLFASLKQLSALYMIWEQARRDFDGKFYRIEGGNDGLPFEFARRLGKNIVYNSQVTHVVREGDTLAVQYSREGRSERLGTDRVICTLPLPAARRVIFDPPLAALKRQALEQIGYTSLLKTHLQFSKRFWQGRWSACGYSDTPLQYLLHTTSDQPGVRGIVTSFSTGSFAKQLGAMGDGALPFARDLLAEMDPAAAEAYEGGYIKNWDTDPWVGGTHPQFNVGQMTAFWPELSRSEGSLHFAGEHTSFFTGWMNGALQSADRVVREILGGDRA